MMETLAITLSSLLLAIKLHKSYHTSMLFVLRTNKCNSTHAMFTQHNIIVNSHTHTDTVEIRIDKDKNITENCK